MKLEKLFNADVLMEKHKNKVVGEHVTNIVMDEDYFVKHSIYFAESLNVFEDENKTRRLVEGRDYNFSVIDSISSEIANKDCYRAIVFLTDVEEAWIDYHSYGDIISAEKFNELIKALNSGAEISDELKNELNKLIKSLNAHINDKAPHGSSVSAENSTLVLRTDKGAIKTKTAENDDESVNLGQQNKALQEQKKDLQEEVNNARTELFNYTEELEKKVTVKTPVLTIEKFLPDDFKELPPPKQAKAMQEAQEILNSELEKTEARFNVVRNKNGSVTVPEAVDDGDAVNKKMLEEKQSDLTKIVDDKLKEALKNLDIATGIKDVFDFKDTSVVGNTILFGEAIKTNKVWAGKTVWRTGATFSFTFNLQKKKIETYALIEDFKNNEKLTHDDIEIICLDGLVKENAPASAGAYGDDSFYSLRDIASTAIQKTVASAPTPNTWWIQVIPKSLKTYTFKIWFEFTKVE